MQTYSEEETRKGHEKEIKQEKELIKEKRKKIKLAIRSTYVSRERIVYKSKSIRISLQKHNKMAKRISFQIPIAVKSSTIKENMSL